MYEKIINALKLKYASIGVSDKVLVPIAKMIEANTTDESSIEAAVVGVELLLKGVQSEADGRVADAVKKAKVEPKATEPAEPKKVETADDVPSWAKALVESNTKLAEKLTALEADKTSTNRVAKFNEAVKDFDKGFTAPILKNLGRMNFADDAEFDAFIDETIKDYKAVETSKANESLGLPRPAFGTGKPSADKVDEAAAKEIAASIINI